MHFPSFFHNKPFPVKALSLLAVAALVACGGGGGSGPENTGGGPESPPPAPRGALALVAGNTTVFGYQDGAAPEALLGREAVRMAMTPSGEWVIADPANNAIRQYTPATGQVATLAGGSQPRGPQPSSHFADGTGTQARFWRPSSVVVSTDGLVYVADTGNHVVRRVMPDGTVSVIAGRPGVCGTDDGPAAQATFCQPRGIQRDGAGNLFVLSAATAGPRPQYQVRKIDRHSGQVSTVVTTSTEYPSGFALARDGSVLMAHGRLVQQHRPDGSVLDIGQAGASDGVALDGPASAARFALVVDMQVDTDGNVLVLDADPYLGPDQAGRRIRIRRIDAQGHVTTVGQWQPTLPAARAAALALDHAGRLYVTELDGSAWVARLERDGSSAVVLGKAAPMASGAPGAGVLPAPSALAIMPDGNLLVSSSLPGPALQSISAAGAVQPVALQRPPGSAYPGWRSLAVDKSGSVFTGSFATQVADPTLVFRSQPQGTVEQWLDLSAWIHPFAYRGREYRYRAAIGGMAMDAAGTMYVAGVNGVVLKISPDKQVTVLAGKPDELGHVDGPGDQARFSILGNLAVDCEGNVLATDGLHDAYTGIGPTIRKITPQGVVSTVAGRADNPAGLEDGPARDARFSFAAYGVWNFQWFSLGEDVAGLEEAGAAHLVSDPQCNVYMTDPVNSLIRRLSAAGKVETLAGQAGRHGFQPGPLPGLVNHPVGIAMQNGRVFFTMRDAVAHIDVP